MSVDMLCEGCGAQFVVTASEVGRRAVCARCGWRFEITYSDVCPRPPETDEAPRSLPHRLTPVSTTAPPFSVFISHSQKDRTVAKAACDALEARGIRCWIAPRDIAYGTEWSAAIVQAIERCPFMVLIFSKHANKSEHVSREVHHAMSKKRTVLPFRVDKSLPNESLEYFLANTQWMDAYSRSLEQHVQHLADSVDLMLAGRAADGQLNGTGRLDHAHQLANGLTTLAAIIREQSRPWLTRAIETSRALIRRLLRLLDDPTARNVPPRDRANE